MRRIVIALSWLILAGYALAAPSVNGLFADNLVLQREMPIGLVNAALGGTRIETWMAPESFSGDPVLEKNAPTANEYNLRIPEEGKHE